MRKEDIVIALHDGQLHHDGEESRIAPRSRLARTSVCSSSSIFAWRTRGRGMATGMKDWTRSIAEQGESNALGPFCLRSILPSGCDTWRRWAPPTWCPEGSSPERTTVLTWTYTSSYTASLVTSRLAQLSEKHTLLMLARSRSIPDSQSRWYLMPV